MTAKTQLNDKILIVDDSVFMRKIIKDLLLKNKYEHLVEAENFRQALEQFKREKPDLVLLDIILPDKNGIEVLKEIRKIDARAKVAIISAVGQQQYMAEARKLGVTEYLVKPFEEKKVIAAVKKLLG